MKSQSLIMFFCQEPNCGRRFVRKYDLRRHIHQLHGEAIMEKCFLCGQLAENRQILEAHYRKVHRPSRHFIVKDSAFNRNVITFRYNFLENERDFVKAQLGIKHLLRRQIQIECGVQDEKDDLVSPDKYFYSNIEVSNSNESFSYN